MREAFAAVAEFLAHHGGLDEYDAVLKSMQHLGWTLEQDHPARWRALFTVLKAELSDPSQPTNYVFLFERLLQLSVRIPTETAHDLFSSKLVFHAIVERFEAAYEAYDGEIFKLESDVLCHTENIYSMCILLEKKLYRRDDTSALRTFLRKFKILFDQEEPKAAWEAFRDQYRLPEVVFRRDMKRVLWSVEDQVFGKTQIEQLIPSQEPMDKRIIVPRRILESMFTGSSTDWRQMGTVVSVAGLTTEPPSEERRVSLARASPGPGAAAEMVGETPPENEHEDRVWSARLPIATPGGGSDSEDSSSDIDTAMDDVVRQEKPTQKSPGKAKKNAARQSRPQAASSSPRRPRATQPEEQPRGRRGGSAAAARGVASPSPQRRAAAKKRTREQDQTAEEIDNDNDEDEDEFLDAAREIRPNPKQRRGRKFWSEAEVNALIRGVKRYGGQWSAIKRAHSETLRNRSNVDIKDKYRNLVKAKKVPPLHAE